MKAFTTIIASILVANTMIAQEPGSLYLDFGTGGVFTELWDDTVTQANDIDVSWNGTIIVPGHIKTTDPPEEQIYVISLGRHGTILPFGNTSRGFLQDLADVEFATSVIALPDNKILIAGYYMPTIVYQPFVMRLFANGEIDETFADHGIFSSDEIWMEVKDIDVFGNPESYKIVLCGKDDSDYPQMIVMDQAGHLDPSFGTDGIARYESRNGYYSDIIADNESHTLYACMVLSGGKTALAKYELPGGTPDDAFGTGGILSSESFEDLELTFNAIVFDRSNNLLAAFGQYRHSTGDMDMCALRVNASSGQIDLTFGVNGWAWLRSADHDENLFAAIQQSDGKYYIGGYTDYAGDEDFMLGRLNMNGTADATFGNNGLVLTIAPFDNRIRAFALSPSENILYAAGYSIGTEWKAMNVAAYYTGYESEPPVSDKADQASSITVYPNPVADRILISTGQAGIHRVQIMDMAGKEICLFRYKSEEFELNLESLKPSVYLIRLTLPDDHIRIYKFVKE
jgi:uncharacterized delta-60 repeat protein